MFKEAWGKWYELNEERQKIERKENKVKKRWSERIKAGRQE